ncbi:tRNA preQ1(34) S-adenosylmethionine ribosyltransferase-isomerase QueA [Parvularcula marina]|uniref:S-adenosylmethionine:tRNA ribosyltransferase-isomerase n=1 Tax=Parvularcula marina TaxID=2292771 RepID=A0A371REQ7_9PROT|nr:tRNA preQ1(34) S-adenosylmethionine ribosyltransferase-isomerase QueA [Parvularcula marina]RFB03936.1 tRNA preQ1(34) S-adenosylmethionine ribosyltransferase-isomerase QueA [Parvularcula marina]
MRTDEFDYDLPEELIALEPSDARDGSRLLHLPASGPVHHRQFRDLLALFGEDDVLVLNDTRVFPAALKAIRKAREVGGGGDVTIDINLHKFIREENGETIWRAFVRPAKRLAVSDELFMPAGLTARVITREGPEADLAFPGSRDEVLARLDEAGEMPLPPYIARKRAAGTPDRERYQTVFAEKTGSVAAPTAGLHFTDELLSQLEARGTQIVRVTLHVGAGTFLPVSAENIEDHQMHSEWGEVSEAAAVALNAAMASGKRITCVGTTAMRLVESASSGPREIAPFSDETDIFITPGYAFRIADRLITNFHLPKSTLLMLVSAFSGKSRILAAYEEAIAERYRFFSYGDACLLERTT